MRQQPEVGDERDGEGDPERIGSSRLAMRLGVAPCTLTRWCKTGKFPRPHYIGEKRAWFLHEVEAWERQEMTRTVEERRGARNLTGLAGR